MNNSRLFPKLKTLLKNDQTVVVATVVRGPETLLGQKALVSLDCEPHGPLLNQSWALDLCHDACMLMMSGQSAIRRYQNDEVEVFFDVQLASPRLVIVGAVHIAEALIGYAKSLGFRTWLVDPRTAFATPARFPHADEICHQWPDEALPAIGLTDQTAVVIITHDPKLDDPALKLALPSPAFYVGVLGSPRTHAQRLERLQAAGLSPALLERMHAPIGLDLASRTPAEIALSIMAQIIAVRNNAPLFNHRQSAAPFTTTGK